MPAVHQTIRFRNQRREKSRRKPLLQIGILFCVVFSLAAAAAGLLLAVEFAGLTEDLPSIEALPGLLEPPSGQLLEPTRFYDRTGQQIIFTLQSGSEGQRAYLTYPSQPLDLNGSEIPNSLPPGLIDMIVAAVDPGFWTHPGVTINSLLSPSQRTIAQRLAADLLLYHEPPDVRRDARQNLLALQMINRFGREKVIEWYLNSAYFGNLAFGAQAASELYFGKQVSELELAETALLAGVADNPAINPWDAPQFAQTQQKEVIREALRLRLVSPSESVQAIRVEPKTTLAPKLRSNFEFTNLYPGISESFVKMTMEQLRTRIQRSELERGGFKVITTLDLDLQTQVVCASQQLESRRQAAPNQPQAGVPVDCPAARLLPALPTDGDQTVENLTTETVVLDPVTGQILALDGKADGDIEGEILPEHPAGTLSYFFIYMTGFTRGLSPSSLVWDIPFSEETGVQQNDRSYHGPVRLRIALANDYQPPAESVLSQVGADNVARTAQQLGLQNPRNTTATPVSAMSLLRNINLIEITHALSAFAHQGTLAGRTFENGSQTTIQSANGSQNLAPILPTTILHVEDMNGRIRLDWNAPQERPILTPQLAYLMTHVLSDETARWPSLGHPNPLETGRPAAAKISSGPNAQSTWVLGYTPRRVVGVWMGPSQDSVEPIDPGTDLAQPAAASLWHAIMQYSNQTLPYEAFPVPAGISFSQVCDPSGLLPTAACPNVVDEVFLSGNEPVQIDTLYRMVSINRDNGQLATIFTPPDLVEQRAYISIPPEAKIWAQKSDLETPPDIYDNLPLQTTNWANTKITSPKMLDHLGGIVKISGKAAGPDFSFYRIQYGKGPSPTRWFQVGDDNSTPAAGGFLANWDTTELDGLYALQLLLVRQDQSAERSTIFVTVDNQPPAIEIMSPKRSETIRQKERPRIVLQAEIDEGMSLASVIFRIDRRVIANLLQAPYAISWSVNPGDHVFEVTATDEAGNTSTEAINFRVE